MVGRTRSGRDPWIDNAKTVLVTVVVVGHALVLLPSGDLTSRVYDFIYYFHIPAFVLVTGYLSRSFRWSRRHLTLLVTTLVIPYLVFEPLMAGFRVWVGDVDSLDVLAPLWLDPHWPMWYLIVLVIWRLATPVLRVHWLMVPVSVAISLAAGAVQLDTFDLNRALGFLPFFVLGLHLPDRGVSALKWRWSVVPGVLVLAWIWWLAARTDDHWSTQWLYFRSSYDELGADLLTGVETRAQLLAIGTAGALALFCLVPRRQGVLSAMGAYTMGVYLLHGFPIRYVESLGWEEWMPGDSWTSVLLTSGAAVLLALVLAWPPVARRLEWVVDTTNRVGQARGARWARQGPR